MNQSEALKEISAGKLRPVFLIYGGEPFLEAELVQAIRSAIITPETADFNDHVIHPCPDQIDQALQVARTQPFFAQQRLVVVRDSPLFAAARKKQEAEEIEEEKSSGLDDALLAYLKQPVPSTCLVFHMAGSVDSRKRVTKAVIAAGGAVECKQLAETEAILWAMQRASFYHKRLDDHPARLLIEKTGRDLRLIDSELQKLALYRYDQATISLVDIDLLVGGVAETEIFRLTDAVMAKERVRAVTLLARVLQQVDHPLQALAAITNRFRQALLVKGLIARGLSSKEGAALARMHPFPYDKMASHLRRTNRIELVNGLAKLLEADLAIKSGQDAVLTLERLVVELMESPQKTG